MSEERLSHVALREHLLADHREQLLERYGADEVEAGFLYYPSSRLLSLHAELDSKS